MQQTLDNEHLADAARPQRVRAARRLGRECHRLSVQDASAHIPAQMLFSGRCGSPVPGDVLHAAGERQSLRVSARFGEVAGPALRGTQREPALPVPGKVRLGAGRESQGPGPGLQEAGLPERARLRGPLGPLAAPRVRVLRAPALGRRGPVQSDGHQSHNPRAARPLPAEARPAGLRARYRRGSALGGGGLCAPVLCEHAGVSAGDPLCDTAAAAAPARVRRRAQHSGPLDSALCHLPSAISLLTSAFCLLPSAFCASAILCLCSARLFDTHSLSEACLYSSAKLTWHLLGILFSFIVAIFSVASIIHSILQRIFSKFTQFVRKIKLQMKTLSFWEDFQKI